VSPNGLNQTYGADAASLALAVLTPIVAALAALTVALLASYARGNTTTTAAHPTGAAGGGHRPQAERHHARAIRPGRPHGGQPDGRRRRMSSVNEAKSE
jgi:hypothetical protein